MRYVEAEYRAPGGLLAHLCLLAFALWILVVATRDNAASLFIGFAVLFVAIATYNLLFQPYKIRLSADDSVAFRSLARTRVVPIADGCSIEIQARAGVSLRFRFAQGSVTTWSWPQFHSAAEQLQRRNPAIRYDDEQ